MKIQLFIYEELPSDVQRALILYIYLCQGG